MTQVGCLEEWAKVEAAKATKAAKAAQEDSFDDAEAREPTPKPKRNVADVELKDILRGRDLRVSGRKADLVDRLVDADAARPA